MFNEQQMILRTFETDTTQALSTADLRSRAFVDELRDQLLHSKSEENSERERVEQRMNQRIDEMKRALDKYVNDVHRRILQSPPASTMGSRNESIDASKTRFSSSRSEQRPSTIITDERGPATR